ncbi:CRISPR system Cascade subunit CasB [Pseudoclavibacter chungangensis]|nr:type I-E CRISPR-associated protein Cse2/CasB [Pseudoclavibacter chungangensis]NYJ68619.1 CRISPR system Cascade subunit CasB [Pseudoclavibacter chungangensis]
MTIASDNAAATPERPAVGRYAERGAVAHAVTSAIAHITRGGETARSRAALARLRQSIGRPIGSVPETWEFVIELPADLTKYPTSDPAAGQSGASAAELAVNSALGLWALHQQSTSTPAHEHDARFGAAVRRLERTLGAETDTTSPVQRRFTALVRSRTVAGVLVHARGLVSQMRDVRNGGVSFDYGLFAEDLLRLQNPRTANRVRLDWGRAFQNSVADSVADESASPNTPTSDASVDATTEEH